MSTLKVTNIQATGETATRAVSGICGSWCNWDENSSVNDSLNVSSVDDGGTGINTVNYSSSFANGSYANGGAARESALGGEAFMRLSTTHTTAATRWICENESGGDIDGEMRTVSAHGDLA